LCRCSRLTTLFRLFLGTLAAEKSLLESANTFLLLLSLNPLLLELLLLLTALLSKRKGALTGIQLFASASIVVMFITVSRFLLLDAVVGVKTRRGIR
jgi:hypothetical protein